MRVTFEVAFQALPPSLHRHCTDEAQKAETVLSAVYIYIYIYIVYVIESAAYGVIFTSCLCENPNEGVRAFHTNNE